MTGQGTRRASELDQLTTDLEARFRVVATTLALGDRPIELLHPANADDLISEADYVRDERLPYWADIWPSARVLAERVLLLPGQGRRLLELGCGSGLVSAAAARAGFDVIASDYYQDALLFARANALRDGSRPIGSRHVDWRDVPADLGQFDVVVASDVLYEPPYPALVAAAIARTMSREGMALIADPGRLAAPMFGDECRANGLTVSARERVPFVDGEIQQTIDIYELRRDGQPER